MVVNKSNIKDIILRGIQGNKLYYGEKLLWKKQASEGKRLKGKFTDDSTDTSWYVYINGNKQALEKEFDIVIDEDVLYGRSSEGGSWFSNRLEYLYDFPSTDKITNMKEMFYPGTTLQTVNATNWVVDNVENMESLFGYCSLLQSVGDLTNWNVENVNNMFVMFYNCKSLESVGDLSGWDVGKVTNMGFMFANCETLQSVGDLTNWNVENVENMQALFGKCKSFQTLGDLSGWDVGKVTNMNEMFSGCESLESVGDLSGWNTENVTKLHSTFLNCKLFQSLDFVNNWNVGKVTDMDSMFNGCESLESLDLTNWNTENVENIAFMFSGCSSLKSLDLSGWNTEKITQNNNVQRCFYNCSSLEKLNISGWNLEKLNTVSNLFFYGCTSLKKIYMCGCNQATINLIKTYKPSQAEIITDNCEDFYKEEGVIEKINKFIDGSNQSDWYYLHNDGTKTNLTNPFSTENIYAYSNLDEFNDDMEAVSCVRFSDALEYLTDVTTFDTEQMDEEAEGVEPDWCVGYYSLSRAFYKMPNLKAVDLSELFKSKTFKPTNVKRMFAECPNLEYVDVTNLDLSNLEDKNDCYTGTGKSAEYLFAQCPKLKTVKGVGTIKGITSMTRWFYGCTALEEIDLSGLKVGVIPATQMFYNCPNLKKIYMIGCDENTISRVKANIPAGQSVEIITD